MFDFEEELKNLPHRPGVYIMHDENDTILYVGKAVDLHNRVRSYFRRIRGRGPQILKMVEQISRFEYIVTDSELEALVLENNLIKEHSPKYNTLLKDDKTYPYIKVTLGEEYPRILFSREMKKDKSRYFGPYTSAAAVKETIDLLNKLFKIGTCNRNLPKDIGLERACLNHHIGQCDAPCQGQCSEAAYGENVKGVLEFLKGHYQPEIDRLTAKMLEASEELRFEEAARYRDTIDSIRQVGERQKITETSGEDRDVLAIALADDPDHVTGRNAVVQVFFVRGGKLIGREHFLLTADDTDDPAHVLGAFISQYYRDTPFVPRELMLDRDVPDRALLEEFLTGRRGSKATIRIPRKGIKEKLVAMARENAEMVLARDRDRLMREQLRTIGAVREIADLLGLEKADRMESYDISNISGFDSVGSMIVFDKGKPKKSDYRKFKIKWVQGPNDYASMEEVLTRRFRRALEGDESFKTLPDVILMDGGRGQGNVALDVLRELGLDIPVAGMVKDDFHRTRGLYFNNVELPIARDSEGFKLLTRIQDEVHRFAIEYHRQLRSKGQVHSVLDDIEGIGPARRKALLRTFKTMEAIRDASEEELLHAPSMNAAAARRVWDYFHPAKAEGRLQEPENMV